MSQTVKLKHPIEAHGEEVSELTFRRLTMGDLIRLDSAKGEMAKVAKLIELCAAIPPSSVAKIDAEDIAAISEVVGSFLPSSLPTGESAESD